jgi:peptide subunit release factor 1 (eRF1)
MRASEHLIRELIHLARADRMILSAYLDLTAGREAAERFVDRESARILPLLHDQDAVHFKKSLFFLTGLLKKKKSAHSDSPGLAFFAVPGTDFTVDVDLAAAPEPLLAIDHEAIVFPLALQLDEYEPVGVIMIDAHCVRVFIAAGQTIENIDSLCQKIHHLSKVGGWSQMRYQRRREKEVHRFTGEALQKAAEIFQQAGVHRIVIGGRDRMVDALEKELPDAWHDMVIGTVRWDLDAPDDELLGKIRPLLEEAERTQEQHLLEKLLAQIRRHGLAVAGAEQTLKALQLGQVDTLLISRSLDSKKTEQFVDLAESSAAHIEFIPGENESLARLGGVGALLRYNIS